MRTRIFDSDRELLDAWEDFCISKRWTSHEQIKAAIKNKKIKFTNSGSILAPDGVSIRIMSIEQLKSILNAGNEVIALSVINIYSGNILFNSIDIEKTFWEILIDIGVPLEFIPQYFLDMINSEK